jgi:hypothetical protein
MFGGFSASDYQRRKYQQKVEIRARLMKLYFEEGVSVK